MIELRPFQRRFLKGALADHVDTAALSIPRGNGKSALAAHIVAKVLDPADDLFRAGTESVLCAATIEQARVVYRFARAELEDRGGYRFLDSGNRIAITHEATRTRLRVIGSNGKAAMGLVNCPWAICDEPGAWEVNGGELLHDAIETAKGKPGSPLKALYIGTLAPARWGWWHDLVDEGSNGSTYVQALIGDPARWDDWHMIRKCNPLTAVSAKFRKKLLEERDLARRHSRLKARFLSYRLNLPTADESTVLLTVDDWNAVLARELPPRDGRPIVGLDLGHGRAWSAAVALWHNGRIEALAIAPGLPSIEEQEKRDRVPKGVYARLVESGALQVASGLRVPPVKALVDAVRPWGPRFIVCDRFNLDRLKDAARGIRIVDRVTRWSEATEDIVALRRFAADGPLAVAPSSSLLVEASLAVATVKNDDQGSTRIVKRDPANNTGRDDVAVALTLAAGAVSRAPARRRGIYHGKI